MVRVFATEWGYFIGHPPSPEAPSIVSRLLDTEYTSKICRLAFPDGKVNRASLLRRDRMIRLLNF